MRKVLLIEDDPTITDFMEVVLAKEHYHVTIATTGMEALNVFQENSFDLLLLDLGLPDIDGIELLKIIRKRLATPLIVISARNNEHEKVKALDLGADDYVTKPFGMNELLARIRTAFRHRKQEELPSVITNGELSLDTESQLLTKAGEPIHLTKNEYRILLVLFQHLGKVVTYRVLTSEVWGPYGTDSQVLRVNMSNIRKKIEKNTISPEYLITEIGVGYRLRDYRSS
ncbi:MULTISPECIES: response regulator transcription factor [Enterococcus]|uniref:DNA-binding response regulator n=1 Tax=Enterococcus mundtii TaxID=53346 RepID=A0A2S7RXU5_ENTMU|nr:response regulator transcription factor [Enterococcus mundtii]MDA9462140.1 DNA-binding response regulator KdpE [Enterococcus mundtii 3F]PQF24918.1 DNA-binding response regulator [Enterococcus mundtii]PTO36986.1 DNA-binding response regulator [Enterococcus mundtii]PTO43441.1 DNA-binding response regulator [Enterococcus mundtii]